MLKTNQEEVKIAKDGEDLSWLYIKIKKDHMNLSLLFQEAQIVTQQEVWDQGIFYPWGYRIPGKT